MDTSKTRYGNKLLKISALKKDRTRISMEFTILLVWNHRNEILGSAAIMRDVTERWQQEKELNERLKSLEDQLELQNNT